MNNPLDSFIKKKLPTKNNSSPSKFNFNFKDFIKKDTTSKNMPVISKTGVPIIDYPEQYNTVKNKFVVNMPPQKYFDVLQKELLTQAKKNKRRTPEEIHRLKKETPEEFREHLGGMYEDRIQGYMKDLKEGKDVPTGYILKSETISEKGKPSTHVEFDTPSGIEAARRLGIPKVPVVLAEGRTSKYTKGRFWPQWEYSDTELEKARDEASRYTITQDDIRKTDTDNGTVFSIGGKMLKKGARYGSPYESDYEDDASDKWREVTTIDTSKAKDEPEHDWTSKGMAFDINMKTGTPLFDYPASFGFKGTKKYENPAKLFNKLKLDGELDTSKNIDEWSEAMNKTSGDEKFRPGQMNELKNAILSKDIMIPPIQIEKRGGLIKMFEGRHRLAASHQLGIDVPVAYSEKLKYENEDELPIDAYIEGDDISNSMAIRFGIKPRGISKEEWVKYKEVLDKVTHKDTPISMPRGQTIKMNTVLKHDKEIKRLEKVNPFWRREDTTPDSKPTWNQKRNTETFNALKEQGYNEDEITSYIAHKNLVAQEFADLLSKQPGMRSIYTKEKVEQETNPEDDERLRRAYKEHELENQTIELRTIKKIEGPTRDETSEQHLLGKPELISEDKKHGKKTIMYSTAEGIPIYFKTNKQTGPENYPSVDDVGYLLDTLPVNALPSAKHELKGAKGLTIEFSPRQGNTNRIVRHNTAGHYDSTTNTLRVFSRQTPEEETKSRAIESYRYKSFHDPELRGLPIDVKKRKALILAKQRYEENKDKFELSPETKTAMEKKRTSNFKEVFVHELGHAVDFNRTLGGFQQTPGTPYKDAKLKHKESPTRYGAKNPREDLAESFLGYQKMSSYHGVNPKTNPEAIKARKELFEKHAADLQFQSNPNVRESVEEVMTPSSFLDEERLERSPNLVMTAKSYELERDAAEKQHPKKEEE